MHLLAGTRFARVTLMGLWSRKQSHEHPNLAPCFDIVRGQQKAPLNRARRKSSGVVGNSFWVTRLRDSRENLLTCTNVRGGRAIGVGTSIKLCFNCLFSSAGLLTRDGSMSGRGVRLWACIDTDSGEVRADHAWVRVSQFGTDSESVRGREKRPSLSGERAAAHPSERH